MPHAAAAPAPTSTPPVIAPTDARQRVLAPDLVRGSMLLAIALANAAEILQSTGAFGHVAGAERLVGVAFYTLVHSRAYPVFAVMFGYGIAQMAARQAALGTPAAVVRRLLVRRHLWLIAFGFAHAALLYHGDFLAAYGIAGLLATWLLVPRGPRGLSRVGWLWALMAVEVAVLAGMVVWQAAGDAGQAAVFAPPPVPAAITAESYAASARARLQFWPAHTARVVPFVVIVWAGLWAGRLRLLDEPRRHRRVLAAAACGGLAITWAGGLPMGLLTAGWLQAGEATAGVVAYLHQVSGMFGGPGYAAAGGLAAGWITSRPAWRRGFAVEMVAALGQRSLSGYLFQSAAWLALLAPFGLAWGRGSARPLLAALAVACAVWTVSLAASWWLARAGRRGPAESLLRRLVYGPGRGVGPSAARIPAPGPGARPLPGGTPDRQPPDPRRQGRAT